MGCDGGTIPRRDELVRLKKKPEQKDKDSELAYRWRHCALTQQPLTSPIVMCGLGRLYSKQNIIEYLLEKNKTIESVKHIKSLKDVKDLVLTPNPIYKDCGKTEGSWDVRSAPYICKLIGLEMTGKFRFIALWSCGCVFSERALKELKTKICSLCQTPYENEDIIILNGSDEELPVLMSKMETRLTKRKLEKKVKTKKIETVTSSTCSTVVSSNTQELSEPSTSIKDNTKLMNNTCFATAASIPSVSSSIVLAKKRKESSTELLIDPALKKLKDDSFSVAADPKASNVYKSLFTSHKSEQEQDRAHWVTYNPFYN